jgi:hypothetical protein
MVSHPITVQDLCDEGIQFESTYVHSALPHMLQTDLKNSIFQYYIHYLLLKPTKSSDTLSLCLSLCPIPHSAHNPRSLPICLDLSSLVGIRNKT